MKTFMFICIKETLNTFQLNIELSIRLIDELMYLFVVKV